MKRLLFTIAIGVFVISLSAVYKSQASQNIPSPCAKTCMIDLEMGSQLFIPLDTLLRAHAKVWKLSTLSITPSATKCYTDRFKKLVDSARKLYPKTFVIFEFDKGGVYQFTHPKHTGYWALLAADVIVSHGPCENK